MNIRFGRFGKNYYAQVFDFIRCSDVIVGDEIEQAAYLEIMYRLLGKMQNRLFSGFRNPNQAIPFTLSASEAWAFRKLYYSHQWNSCTAVYIYPIIERIEKHVNIIYIKK